MRWTKDHDLILLKEILLFELYSQKRGSPERGRVWEQIAESLNGQREDKILFKVSQRSVRNRFNVLKNNSAKQHREEERVLVFHLKFLKLMSVCRTYIIERNKEMKIKERRMREKKRGSQKMH